MANISTLNELFVEELRDLYDAEKQLTKALPKMAKAASSDELRPAFTNICNRRKAMWNVWNRCSRHWAKSSGQEMRRYGRSGEGRRRDRERD